MGCHVNDARTALYSHPELLIYPGLCIFVTAAGFNLFGEALRDILMPEEDSLTHDFATALQLGGNMLVMKEGKIIESGEVQSVFDHTTEPYTRSLIEAYSLSCAFTKGAES